MKSCLRHRFLDERLLSEGTRIDSEITVLRGFSDGNRRLTCVHIDGLRPDNDDRLAVLAERFQSVEQGRSSTNE
jgi:hypothetical protein